MENKSYHSIIGSTAAPYINSLAASCGLATEFQNETHPSGPNYIASTSGYITKKHPSVFRQLEMAGLSWKSYMESMPANCYKTATADGLYTPGHNPAVYYPDVQATCPVRDVPLAELSRDLAADALPSLAFISPNQVNNMHSSQSPAAGDKWLQNWIPRITDTPDYQAGRTVIMVTWDEGKVNLGYKGEDCADPANTDPSCHIATLVLSAQTAPGTRSSRFFTHYSMLRTLENNFGLPALGNAASASSMAAAFGL
jgi:phosphatidylinositol-3-phosphatase